jgi:hypothetical protein
MKTKSSQRVFRLIIASVILCGPSLAYPAFIKTNFASSITGESMSAVWVAQQISGRCGGEGFFHEDWRTAALV